MRSHAKASSAGLSVRPGRVWGCALLLAALFLLSLAPSAFAVPTRSYSSSFGTGDYINANPQSVAVDQASGDIYAVNNINDSVHRYTPAGTPDNFTAGPNIGTNTLTGIDFLNIGEGQVAIDNSGGPADGRIYVADAGNKVVKIFATDGSPLGSLTGSGTPAGLFGSAVGVAVNQATGDLYIADPSNRIWRYTPSGATVAESDYSGGIDPGFGPGQLAADSGHVYATNVASAISGGNLIRFRASDFATGAPPSATGATIDTTTKAVAVNPLNGDVYANRGGQIAVYQSGIAAGVSPYYTFGSATDFGTSSQGVAVKAGGPAYVADRHTGGKEIDVYGVETPAPTRSYSSSFGTGDYINANPQSVAVDQASGDIYAVNNINDSVHRYTPAGTPDNFTAGPNIGTNTLTGIDFLNIGEGQVAIDNSGGPADGRIYVADAGNKVVKIFATDGSPLGSLTGSGTPAGLFGSAVGVAVNQATGDLYIADPSNRIWRYTPSGATVAESDYSGGIDPGFGPGQLAADSGHVYATNVASAISGGNLIRFRASDFATGAPPSATGATIDTTTKAVAVNPLNGDVYANRGGQIAVYQSGIAAGVSPYYTFGSATDFGTSSQGVAVKAGGPAYVADRHTGGKEIDVYGVEITGFPLTVAKAGPGTGTITSSPPGIDCGTTCAATLGGTLTLTAAADPGSNFNGWTGCNSVSAGQCTVTMSTARSITANFTAKPSVSEVKATQIGAHAATLKALVNPNGESTAWHFEYTDDADFQENGFSNAIKKPVPDASAGSGTAGVAVSTSLTGLAAATTYHFRIVANNSLGSAEVEEAFATYMDPVTFLACDNDGFRTGPGARLPDCRAYEQASPVEQERLGCGRPAQHG